MWRNVYQWVRGTAEVSAEAMPWTCKLIERKSEPALEQVDVLRKKAEEAAASEVLRRDFAKAAQGEQTVREKTEEKVLAAEARLNQNKSDNHVIDTPKPSSERGTPHTTPERQHTPMSPTSSGDTTNIPRNWEEYMTDTSQPDFNAAVNPPPELPTPQVSANEPETLGLQDGPPPPDGIGQIVDQQVRESNAARLAEANYDPPTPQSPQTTTDSFNEVSKPDLNTTFNNKSGPSV